MKHFMEDSCAAGDVRLCMPGQSRGALTLCREINEDRLLFDADWILLRENDHFLGSAPILPPKKTEDELTVPPWTDLFSSVFPLLHY